MSKPISLDERRFEQTLREHRGPVVVDFFATWCGPCKALAPALDRLAEEHPEVLVAKVDVDRSPDLAGRFGVRGVPTLIRFDAGSPTLTVSGNRPYDQLLQALRIEPARSAAA